MKTFSKINGKIIYESSEKAWKRFFDSDKGKMWEKELNEKLTKQLQKEYPEGIETAFKKSIINLLDDYKKWTKDEAIKSLSDLILEYTRKDGLSKIYSTSPPLSNFEKFMLDIFKEEREYHKSRDENDLFSNINYTKLHKKLLHTYIKDVSISDFTEIINYKRLPNGKNKICWIGYKADGFRFSEKFDFTIKQMNECFSFSDGKLKANDKPKDNRTQTDLSKIFKELNL